jgi:hypothetical protein
MYYRKAALYVFFFLWTIGLKTKDIYKEMFSVYGGTSLFTTGSRNSLKDVRMSQMMVGADVAAGVDALLKRWNKCINIVGGWVCREINFIFQVRISHVLRFVAICDPLTDSPTDNSPSPTTEVTFLKNIGTEYIKAIWHLHCC